MDVVLPKALRIPAAYESKAYALKRPRINRACKIRVNYMHSGSRVYVLNSIPSNCLFNAPFSHRNGREIPERISAPINVRGTAPGNEKWSYWARNVSGIFLKGIP